MLGGSRPKSNQFIYSGGAPLYLIWWKSTQGFLIFRVNKVKLAYLDQVHWPLTLDRSRQNLISSSTPSGAPLYQVGNPPRGFWDFALNSLTFDPWRWADLAQNLISSSTPGGVPLYQVWWKSTQGFLRFRVNEGKIAYLDQIRWPLTLDVGRISPKI